jgi:hypothetical protein
LEIKAFDGFMSYESTNKFRCMVFNAFVTSIKKLLKEKLSWIQMKDLIGMVLIPMSIIYTSRSWIPHTHVDTIA